MSSKKKLNSNRPSSTITKKPKQASVLRPHLKPQPALMAQTNPTTSPTAKKTHRRTASDGNYLNPLKGSQRQKAPKIFNNQIFRDIYDEFGNHDRVIDTVESLEVYEELTKGNKVTFNNKSDISTEKFIQPDTSYHSVEVTTKNIREELFQKLQRIAQKPRKTIEEILKPLALERGSRAVFIFSSN